MANPLRSTPPQAQCSAFPSRRIASKAPTGIAPVSLWLPSSAATGLPTAPSAAASRRSSLPTRWLAGLLVLALALGPGALAAPLASILVILALLLAGALGSSAAAGQLGGLVGALIGLPTRHGSLASASRPRTGRAYPPNRPTAR